MNRTCLGIAVAMAAASLAAGAQQAAAPPPPPAFAQPNLHEVHTKLPASMTGWSQQQQKYILPPLPYDYDAR